MVKLKYSGGAANKFATSSLGGAMSTTEIPDATLNNLFDDTTRVEVINGRTEYRCFYIENDSGGDFMKVIFKDLVIPEDAEFSFAVNDPNETPQLLATEDSTPVGLTFYKFSEWRALEVVLGHLEDNDIIAIWIKRKVLAGSDVVQMVDFNIDGEDETFTPTQDWHSIQSSHDNDSITARSPQFFTDEDFCGESLLS